MITPNAGAELGIRDAALIALGVGCSLTALTGPCLMLFGLKRSHARARRAIAPQSTPLTPANA